MSFVRRWLGDFASAITAALLVIGSAAVGIVAVAPAAHAAEVPVNPAPTGSCNLGNGVQHVINIMFDNVHFFRDNPNVPSDLELMPHLKSFLQDNGVLMSNKHTPLIAHTAEDSIAIYTGLYGDRHGMPISNSYKHLQPERDDGPGRRSSYWTTRSTTRRASRRPVTTQAVDGLLADGTGRRRPTRT